MSMPKIECNDIDKCCAVSSLLQSIALEEAAISHILNAEGEKIQKVLCMHNCDCKDLLETNKSVKETIGKITELETVLKEKLTLIVPFLDECCKKPHKPECEHCQ